jgi:hypothetical protein
MRPLLIGVLVSGFIFSAGTALANPPGFPGGLSFGPPPCFACGKAAPAPEIGASLFALAMAGAFGVYVVRRRGRPMA